MTKNNRSWSTETAALVRETASPDPIKALVASRQLRELVARIDVEVGAAAREQGTGWLEIAEASGRTYETARRMYGGDIVRPKSARKTDADLPGVRPAVAARQLGVSPQYLYKMMARGGRGEWWVAVSTEAETRGQVISAETWDRAVADRRIIDVAKADSARVANR